MTASDLIIKAYQNEICIEDWTITVGLVDPSFVANNNLLRYKLLKCYAIFRNQVAFFKFVCNLFLLIPAAKYFFDVLSLAVHKILSRSIERNNIGDLVVTDTTNSHKNFLRVSDRFFDDKNVLHYKSLKSFSTFLAWRDLRTIIVEVWRFRRSLRKSSKSVTRRYFREISLHSIDLVSVIAFIVILERYKMLDTNVYFDQHIQRWAFIISHVIEDQNSNLVQHGFLDSSFSFDHPFGKINSVSIISEDFISEFERVYEVGEFRLLNSSLPIKYMERLSQNIMLFLASQPTSVEIEIRFVDACIEKNIDCLIKLHPKYNYGDLFSKYDGENCIRFVDESIFPHCDVMATFNSFLGYEYRNLDYKVYFLSEYSSTQELHALVDEMVALQP